MHVSPSGNPRRMEQQQYVDGNTASSVIEEMIRKVADTLDLGQDTSQLLQPKSNAAVPAQTAKGNAPAENTDVQNAMNQSNTLPEPDVRSGTGRFENKVNQVAQDVLGSLDLDPSQWTTNTNVSSGAGGEVETISINLKRSAQPQGTKQVEHP